MFLGWSFFKKIERIEFNKKKLWQQKGKTWFSITTNCVPDGVKKGPTTGASMLYIGKKFKFNFVTELKTV